MSVEAWMAIYLDAGSTPAVSIKKDQHNADLFFMTIVEKLKFLIFHLFHLNK